MIPVFKQVSIRRLLKQTIISESAFNDAFGAILFSTVLAGVTMTQETNLSQSALNLVFMIFVGLIVGIGVALIGVALSSNKQYGIFNKYAPIISLVIAILAYEISEELGGSGYMSVFIAGLVASNKKTFHLWIDDEPYIEGVHFRECIATISRMAIFIVLGTHLDLNFLIKYSWKSLLIVLILIFIARPLVVLICTAFDKKANWSWNEKLFMMWIRETGVIPAALSGIVVSNRVPGYEIISSTVFMAIVITLLVQACSTGIVAKKLNVLEE